MLVVTEINWIGDRAAPLAKATRIDVEAKVRDFLTRNEMPKIDYEDLNDLGVVLGSRADLLLYPSKEHWDEVVKMYGRLVDAIALLAFIPDGVEVFGYRYEAILDGSSETRLHGTDLWDADGYWQRGSCQQEQAEKKQAIA